MFRNPWSASTLDDLGLSARCFDSGEGGGAELVRADVQGLGELAGGEHLDGLVIVADEARSLHFHGGDQGSGVELRVEGAQVDDLEVLREMRAEAELGNAALQGILAPFEGRAYGTAFARGLAFAATTGGLAFARRGPASDFETLLARALLGPEFGEIHFTSSTFTRCATTRIMPSRLTLDSLTTLLWMPRRPRASRVRFCFPRERISLWIWVILTWAMLRFLILSPLPRLPGPLRQAGRPGGERRIHFCLFASGGRAIRP